MSQSPSRKSTGCRNRALTLVVSAALSIIHHSHAASPVTAPPPEDAICRFRQTDYLLADYKSRTCAECLVYIQTIHSRVFKAMDGTFSVEESGNYSNYIRTSDGHLLEPDPDNKRTAHVALTKLQSNEKVDEWRDCCRKAELCCTNHINYINDERHRGNRSCHAFWITIDCWPDTAPGVTVTLPCPYWAESDRQMSLECTVNETWFSEMTMADSCLLHSVKRISRLREYQSWSKIPTIVLVIPAIFILLYFRPLRQQQRIKLHICLHVASLLVCVALLMWENLVGVAIMTLAKDGEEHISETDPIWCRLLQCLVKYSHMTLFVAMFVEGFHLHRLLMHAFSTPKSLVPYYLLIFAFPVLPVATWVIVSEVKDITVFCYIHEHHLYDWILHGPNFAALLLNVVFLLRIVFIMVRQLEPHPNEPSNFRRAVKAIGVLVPLFGIQFLLFAYRPEFKDENLQTAYDYVEVTLAGLHGTFISLIFCYFNKEVQGHLRGPCFRFLWRIGLLPERFMNRATTYSSQYVTDMTRTQRGNSERFSVVAANDGQTDPASIPLRPIYCPKEDGPDDVAGTTRNGRIDQKYSPQDTIKEDLNGELNGTSSAEDKCLVGENGRR